MQRLGEEVGVMQVTILVHVGDPTKMEQEVEVEVPFIVIFHGVILHTLQFCTKSSQCSSGAVVGNVTVENV
eukprot:10609461-Ditylum_brightwellii.AAC.1